jgi:hypothetical protein
MTKDMSLERYRLSSSFSKRSISVKSHSCQLTNLSSKACLLGPSAAKSREEPGRP